MQEKKWKVIVEYVPFSNARERERSYEFYAESLVNCYKNYMNQALKAGKERKAGKLEKLI